MTREKSNLLSEAGSKSRQRSGKSFCHKIVLPKPAVLCLLIAVLCVGIAVASGFSKSYSLSTGEVVVTNDQKRSSWHPVAVLFHFTEPVDPTVSIKRLSNGTEYLLSTVTLTNVQDVTWIPEADYPFNFGDALVISTTATNGTLELIQRSD